MNLPVITTVTPTPNPPHSQPPRPPPIPTIPYDILTPIIDQLRHDIPTLRACTLTARSWTHRARVHLHRTFTLPVSVSALPSLSARCDFRFPSEEDEEKFRLMGREAPALLRYADELNLTCVISSSRRGAPIRTILHLLQHIRVLRIIDADLSTISLSSSCHTQASNSSSCNWTTAFPTLDTLVLSKTSLRSPLDVVRLVRSFRELRTFRVEDVTITGASSSHTSDDDSNHAFGVVGNPSFEPLTVRNLHILNCTKAPLLVDVLATHLAYSEGNTNIRRLHVDTTSNLEIFTKTIGNSLPELHLSLQEEFYPLWHVHPEGKVSNMTAPDIRKGWSFLTPSLPRQCKHI
ncbi:hypothetical protein BC629DRAFT_1069448 [Irpex lacteus]|nr:hypothetical protein BC629DRAFT_1069448 [Irpex lacteus]